MPRPSPSTIHIKMQLTLALLHPLALFCRIVVLTMLFFEQPACRTFGNTTDYQQFTRIYESQVTHFFMQPVFDISRQHAMYQRLRRYT